MKTNLSKRLGLAVAAMLGAIGVSMLIPAVALSAMPDPIPAGLNMGGLHLTPNNGDGSETPSFVADSACAAGTGLGNVNTIDTSNTEQTLSGNVLGPVTMTPKWGGKFIIDMATVQGLAGTPGTDESFLFMIDCRTGAGHGTYTDAVQVDYKTDGSWLVHGETPTSPSPSASASKSPSASPTTSKPPSSPSVSPSPSATTSTTTEAPTPTPTASTSTTPAGGNLPVTGVDVYSLVAVALAMIAAGVTLVYAARRRRASGA
ncbi:hypothetical protein [Dactylosporangium sp. CA-139066]|uniref:hypothetical protein n=1 Tax=Dactylosporangium sp. CA-139066 TaxID=3239930 RepID=UPI003D94CD90